MATRRRQRVKPAPPPARSEFDGDDLAWFDATQTFLLDRDDVDTALLLFALMPDEAEELISSRYPIKESTAA